jgi:hypothetical protein
MVPLSHSQGEKMKGDEVADDEDYDMVRTSVYITRPSEGYTVLRNFSSALSLYSSPHTSERSNMRWGKDTDGQHNLFSGPRWVSHLRVGSQYGLQGFG